MLFYFLYVSFENERKNVNNSHHMQAHFAISFSMAHLITELQRERGLTAGFFSTMNQKNNSKADKLKQIEQQWNKTNSAFKQLKQSISKHNQSNFFDLEQMAYITLFVEIMSNRGDILNAIKSSAGKDLFIFYSNLISQGLYIIQRVDNLISHPELFKTLSSYHALRKLQEEVGKERTLLYRVLETQTIDRVQFQNLGSIVVNQKNFYNNFEINATKRYREKLNTQLSHEFVSEVNKIRHSILNRMQRQEILNELLQLIGYGGLIHSFKNYVIRGDEKYYQNFILSYKNIQNIVKTINNTPSVSLEEKKLYEKIIFTFQRYHKMITLAHENRGKNQSYSIKDLDRLVKVDDNIALNAIRKLQHTITYANTRSFWEKASYKVDQYNDIALEIEKSISSYTDNLNQKAQNTLILLSFMNVIILLISVTFVYFLYRRMVTDILYISSHMEKKQKRERTKTKNLVVDGSDEIAQMASIFNQLMNERESFEKNLIEALKTSEAGTRAKSQFLSTMSHEIRTPLNGVLGMAELLSQTELNGEQQEYISIVMSSGQLLLSVINDILDFSKLEASSVVLENIPFNLEKISYDTVKMVLAKAAEKNIELIFNYSVDLPCHFIADPSRLKQIIVNLMNNAIKFTHSGHILLEITGQKLASTNKPQQFYQVTFSVQDTGIGIAKKDQIKLFDSFTQAEQSTTRKYGGTGLGLSICKQLVELMEGEIKIDSTPKKGSNFYFTINLPLTDKMPVASDSDLKNIKALIVDDNLVNLSIFEKLLNFHEINTALTENPEKVIDLIEQSLAVNQLFDVILLDHYMPHLSGLELAKIIRKNPKFDSIRLLLLTSGGTRGDAKKSKDIGFSAYHSKPIRHDLLIQSIKNILANKGRATAHELVTNYNVEESIDNRTLNQEEIFEGHILLAEDNIINQKVALAVLKKLNLTVDIAKDGIEAVKMAQDTDYDLIFMDCQMPNMNGFEATENIRKLKMEQYIPIVALTANALIEDQEQCKKSGMDGFVSKPFKKKDIIDVLDQWL